MAGIAVQSGSAHDTIVLGRVVRLQILHPEPTDPAKQSGLPLPDENAQSLQILADLAGQRILFTADCTKEVERQLLDKDLWPEANILKVAHHGSRMTTEDGFLARVRPDSAVISVGTNLYGHPAADTLLRLSNAGCTIYRTDQAGAVLCRIEPEGYDFTTWLDPTS